MLAIFDLYSSTRTVASNRAWPTCTVYRSVASPSRQHNAIRVPCLHSSSFSRVYFFCQFIAETAAPNRHHRRCLFLNARASFRGSCPLQPTIRAFHIYPSNGKPFGVQILKMCMHPKRWAWRINSRQRAPGNQPPLRAAPTTVPRSHGV